MRKNLDRWMGSYLKGQFKSLLSHSKLVQPVHVMFACVDHFEPDWKNADAQTQRNRIQLWLDRYPKIALNHQDADGHHPKHSFFYPAEVYQSEHLDLLKQVCDQGIGEVDIHLHHHDDTEESLRAILLKAKEDFASHGFLGKRDLSNQIYFAFIHGNWALNNSREDGRFCGVNNETHVLADAGCYADFTFPSAPSETQPKKINSIYHSSSSNLKPKSHDHGRDVAVGEKSQGDLLMIQGPLTLNWKRRIKGIFPRIENGDITGSNPPTNDRVDLWVKQGIGIVHKPEWIFVKVHTHGAQEDNARVLLGDQMDAMYGYLEKKYNDETNFILHYVSAREMFNIVKAGQAGEKGSPGDYRDYMIKKNSL